MLSQNGDHGRRGGADAVCFEHDAPSREAGWGTAFFAMQHPQNLPGERAECFVAELQYGHAYPVLQKPGMTGKVIHSFEARDKLRRPRSRFRPDVAHARNLCHHLSPSVPPFLRREGIPVVPTAHDLKLCCPSKQMRTLPAGEAAAMGAGARRWVAERFTAELYLERMLDLYALLGVGVERPAALN